MKKINLLNPHCNSVSSLSPRFAPGAVLGRPALRVSVASVSRFHAFYNILHRYTVPASRVVKRLSPGNAGGYFPILLLGIFLACSAVATASDSLRTIYTSYIGVREATGRNDGPQVEMFLQHVGLRKGEPWCAAFVSYCLHKAGRASAPYSGWSPAFFPERYRIRRDTTLLPGDVFGIYYQNLRRIAHVGFVDTCIAIKVVHSKDAKHPARYFAPNTDFIPTVEGNTNNNGSREGIGVFRKLRPIKTLRYISRYPLPQDGQH